MTSQLLTISSHPNKKKVFRCPLSICSVQTDYNQNTINIDMNEQFRRGDLSKASLYMHN